MLVQRGSAATWALQPPPPAPAPAPLAAGSLAAAARRPRHEAAWQGPGPRHAHPHPPGTPHSVRTRRRRHAPRHRRRPRHCRHRHPRQASGSAAAGCPRVHPPDGWRRAAAAAPAAPQVPLPVPCRRLHLPPAAAEQAGPRWRSAQGGAQWSRAPPGTTHCHGAPDCRDVAPHRGPPHSRDVVHSCGVALPRGGARTTHSSVTTATRVEVAVHPDVGMPRQGVWMSCRHATTTLRMSAQQRCGRCASCCGCALLLLCKLLLCAAAAVRCSYCASCCALTGSAGCIGQGSR